jgi:dTDP-glucose pyrophosphorylase
MTTIESWQNTLLPIDASIQQAIQNLSASGQQIALVINGDGELVGTITDGDIRRGLLRGLDITSPVETVVHRSPLAVPPEMTRNAVLQLMQANRIHQMPIIDVERRVVGLHTWNKLVTPHERPNMMVIMAGGKGTRLRPFTENCPKPLLPVAGKPMLEHIVERAKAEGFQHFVLAVNYLGHMIEEYFGDGSRWQVRIEYLWEQEPLGTAGAISLLAQRPQVPFLVSNGDVLSDIRYGEFLDFHTRYDATATMAVRLHQWEHPFGVVNTEGVDIIGFEEKPITRTHINAGIYVLAPTAIDSLIVGEHCDMPNLFNRLLERGKRAIVYPMHEPWLDIGQPADFERAQRLAAENNEKLQSAGQ